MVNVAQREKRLARDIARSEKQINNLLTRSRRSVNGTISEYVSQPNYITNAVLRNKLYTQLAGEYKKLDKDMNKWVYGEVENTSKTWWSYAKEDLPVKGTFGAFSERYLSDIIGYINPATVDSQVAMNAQIGGMLTNDIRALRAAVTTTMAEGAVEGLTRPQMAERMYTKVVKTTGQFNFVDKAGRAWTADNYFGMLNRTMHAQAARQTYINVATSELGYDLYEIEGGVSGSSAAYPNDPCDNWAGRIISMTGKTPGYDTYQDALNAGVFHPRCVHFVRALLPSELKAEGIK